MEKIVDIIESLACEKGLGEDEIKDALREAVIDTAKKSIDKDCDYDVEIDGVKKRLKLFQKVMVVRDESPKLIEPKRYIKLSDAILINGEVEIGDELRYELSFEKLGRTGASILQNELEAKIQILIENELFRKYKSKVNKIASGNVIRVDKDDNTYIEIDEIRAVLPKKNRIKGEVFKVGNVVKVLIKKVDISRKDGITMELSRTAPKFLEELLTLEVPEIKDGSIKIMKSARIPGDRAKVALLSNSPKIDAVGATVGVKGVRINAVSKELKNENIDCVEYSDTAEIFVMRALSPAIVSGVKIEDTKAIVTIPSDQKPKAIGKGGVNIRLANMLTGFTIEIVENDDLSISSMGRGEKKRDVSALASLFKE